MKYIISLAAFLLCSAACKDSSKTQIETLKKETMDVHDEAMKDLARMNRVSRKLKDFMISATMTPEQSQVFTSTLVAIEKADDDMTAWMSAYRDPKGKPPAEAIQYLQEQKSKIEKNRDDIRAALTAGEALLAQTQ
ncbi:MAG: hypothetical protein KF734_15215 [Saprospiraceae bacterium]|nr:hypothetical protein [Saprospiraceae bacterium]MCW5920928.1 hypothetical protein [Saprospiraceae bacterium]